MKLKMLLPMLFGFFVMGFGDIIGTVMNQVKEECAANAGTIAWLMPIFAFVWFPTCRSRIVPRRTGHDRARRPLWRLRTPRAFRRVRLVFAEAYGHSETGLQEPGISVLPDGKLYGYFRTDRCFQFESFSDDNGKWLDPTSSVVKQYIISLCRELTSMGVDDMEWFEPYYHATLYPHRPAHNYDYDEDQNGIYVLRSSDDTDDAITAEYVFVHFILQSPRLPGGDVYVCGQWTNGSFDPDCRMEYDEAKQQYEVAVLLKQGYYDYQFRQADGATSRTMGDFYETENEYSVLVYYRAQGARTDRLVGYQRSNVNDQ